jgi:hypothetical protein
MVMLRCPARLLGFYGREVLDEKERKESTLLDEKCRHCCCLYNRVFRNIIRWHSGYFQIICNKNAESTGTASGPNWLSDAKPSTPASLPARGLDSPQG